MELSCKIKASETTLSSVLLRDSILMAAAPSKTGRETNQLVEGGKVGNVLDDVALFSIPGMSASMVVLV